MWGFARDPDHKGELLPAKLRASSKTGKLRVGKNLAARQEATIKAGLRHGLGHLGRVLAELPAHRVDACARHCGHADLLRECIDGRVGQ